MDPPYAEDDSGSKRGGGSRLIRHVIALVLVLIAVTALAAVAWFGYKTWQARGSEGLAPVVQADPGPTRVRPEQPGGIVIPHQERLVLNDLAGGGASVSAESLLPPPEEPMPWPQAAVETPAYAAAEAAPAPVQTAAVTLPPAPAPVQPAVAIATPPVPAPSPVAARDAENKVPAVAAPSTAQVAQAPELITQPAAQAAPAPERVAAGSLMNSHRVQLAAVDSEESARRAWLRYQGLYQDLLGDLSLVVQKVKVNNRDYFRVQGGPLQADGARSICQAIKARGADCLVVRP